MAANGSSKDHAVFLHELNAAGQRRAVLLSGARLLAFGVIVLGLYSVVPIGGFNSQNQLAAWGRLVLVLLVFLAGMAAQLRTVTSAHVPRLRAAESVAESVLLLLCLFALLYSSISLADPLSFSEPLDRVGALYFTTSTFATVGFGDITPTSPLARSLVSVQMIADLGALLAIAKITFFAADRRLMG